MKKLYVVVIIVLLFSNWAFAQEETVALDEVTEVIAQEEKTEAEVTLDNLVEQYKSQAKKRNELNQQIIEVDKNLLRLEGAIALCNDMVKKENKEE